MTRPRTLAREAALQVLYQADLRQDVVLDQLFDELERRPPTEDAQLFSRQLAHGVWEHRESIDQELQAVAHNWDLQRMAAIDRNVLRLASFELLHCPGLPAAVTINEAVLLAKKFSTRDSGSFVNGILDKVYQRSGLDKSGAAPPEEAGPEEDA